MKRAIVLLVASAAMFGLVRPAASHCEIPCGIYDDMMRIRMLQEDITTVEKSMKQILLLSAEEKPDWNQLVRWVNNKEHHANRIQETVTQYFMTQRIKPPKDPLDEKVYFQRLAPLHKLLVAAMKMKQTTRNAWVTAGRKLVDEFAEAYFSPADLKLLRDEHK